MKEPAGIALIALALVKENAWDLSKVQPYLLNGRGVSLIDVLIRSVSRLEGGH